MSLTKNHSIRCDWCGKLSRNQKGEYKRPDGSAGYIHAPNWDMNGSLDTCEECAANRCPHCGSDQIVMKTPAIPGPTGWGGRCKACGEAWGMPEIAAAEGGDQ